ncbi:MAG: molybdenum cofactor guanylyltransferase [Armatimonadetes bacterium]|nr:molybdenum cofactor guanylyltransferase [Armatimonadota bacterium]
MADIELFILAGGKSSRMGRDKASLPFGGEAMLERIVQRLQEAFPRLTVVKAKGQRLPETGAQILEDDMPERGPMGGLYTALKHLERPKCLIVSCDVPFVSAAFLSHLAELPLAGDAIVPVWEGRLQPLQAVYARSILAGVEARIHSGRLQMMDLLKHQAIRVIGDEDILPFAPSGRTFMNVNTPEAYEEALGILV